MTAELPGFQQATAVRNFIEGLNVNRLSNASRVVIAVVLAIAVTSCGGGGGGGGSGGPDPGGNPPPPPPDPPTARLTVTITGQGEVLTPDQTLMCDSSCVFEVDQGANLTLNATPAANYDFNQWQGDCADSADTPTCALAIDSNKNVFAGFKLRVVDNTPPQAAITGEQTGEVNSSLQLSGAQSSDPDGDALTYQWTVLSTPTSANAAFASPTDARTTFAGDLPGIYLVQLVVNDGENSSPPAMFAVGLSVPAPGNTPPVALITGDASGEVLTALQLSGAQSSDADGDSLVYQWSVQSAPALANLQFGSSTQPLTTFQGDVGGLYVISLVVHDGQAPSLPATFAVSLSAPANTPPVAVITGDASGETQALLQLSGAQSSDADGDPLTYQWSVQSAPAAANAVLGSPTQAQTTFQGDVAGTYSVSLVVDDGQESSLPASIQIELTVPSPESVTGTISVSPGNFDPGADLIVTVTDADLNTDSGSVQSVTVTAFNQSTNESELLTLSETASDTGQFAGTIATATGSAGGNNNGQLLVQDGDIVRIEYHDAAPAGIAITRAYVGDLTLMTNAPIMGITNATGLGTAVTFGVVFAPNQLLPNEKPMARIGPDSFDGQVNIMTRYPSGAPQHVLFSHHAPVLPAGDNTSIDFFIDSNPAPTQTLSLAELPNGYATGTAVEIVQTGTQYSVSVADAIQASVQQHFNGSVAAEWVLRAPLTDAAGAEHPWLTARFYVRLYSNGETATIPVLQNVKAFRDNPQRQINLQSVTFRVAGVVRHTENDVAIGHHSLGTPDEVYWWSANDGAYSQSMFVLHDYAYMRDRAVLFPYINPNRSYSDNWYQRTLDDTRAGYGIQGIGLLNSNMPSSAWQGLVGPLPKTNLAWLVTQKPNVGQLQRQQSYEFMFGNALKMGSYHVQVEDENTYEPISIESYPSADLFGSVVAVPAGGGWIYDAPIADTAHQPVIHAVPYFTTGWSYFLRQAKVWQTFNWLYRPHGSSRRPDPSRPEIWSEQQMRAQAWITYNFMDLLRMMPDADPDRGYWSARFDNGIDWYYESYVTPGTQRSPLGFFTMTYPHLPRIHSYMADFLAVAFSHATSVSEITGHGDMQRLAAVRDYGLSGTVNRLMHADAVPEAWALDFWWVRDSRIEDTPGYQAPPLDTMAEIVAMTFELKVDNPARFQPFPSLHPRGGLVPAGLFGSQQRVDEINARIAAWHCSPADPLNCLDAQYQPGDQVTYKWPPGSFAPDSDPLQFPVGRYTVGYVGWKGYPQYSQGAVAAASDAGLTNGAGAWARYQQFTNPWAFRDDQYQFDILPRP